MFNSAGDHLVAMDDLYGGTNRYFRKVAARMNIQTTFVDARNPDNVKNAIKDNTKMVSNQNNKNKIINDPLGQPTVPAYSDFRFILKIKYGRTTCVKIVITIGRDCGHPPGSTIISWSINKSKVL